MHDSLTLTIRAVRPAILPVWFANPQPWYADSDKVDLLYQDRLRLCFKSLLKQVPIVQPLGDATAV